MVDFKGRSMAVNWAKLFGCHSDPNLEILNKDNLKVPVRNWVALIVLLPQ